MQNVILLLGLLTVSTVYAQDFEVNTVTTLSGGLNESSGLIYLEDRIVTHNDSGDGPYLYEINPTDGAITRTVTIANAMSEDWEDICYDSDYIYVGDIGNNSGTRTNLMIFRVLISDYLTTPNDTVYCDTIAFNYADQTDFEPATYSTNYDAEAIIAYNDSLYLFSKNWGNYKTNVYSIPKIPGDYTVTIVDSFNTEGLITAADYDPVKNEILLSGYTLTTPFLFLVKGFSGTAFSEGTLTRVTPGFEGSIQIEGVASLGNHQFYVSSEDHATGGPHLHEITLTNFDEISETETHMILAYPNPVATTLHLNVSEETVVRIIAIDGSEVYQATGSTHHLENLAKGLYHLTVLDTKKRVIYSSRIVKR